MLQRTRAATGFTSVCARLGRRYIHDSHTKKFKAETAAVAAEVVKVSRLGHITVVSINRPHARNAIDVPAGKSLLEAFKQFDADDNQRVAVLTGEAGHFCSGFDLKYLSEHGASVYDPESDGMMVSLCCI
jgi:1,4-dihydroxy-2-naphthoyl-CoA synthase